MFNIKTTIISYKNLYSINKLDCLTIDSLRKLFLSKLLNFFLELGSCRIKRGNNKTFTRTLNLWIQNLDSNIKPSKEYLSIHWHHYTIQRFELIIRLLCLYDCSTILKQRYTVLIIPVMWKTDLNPSPNLPTFVLSNSFMLLYNIFIPLQSSSENLASL